MPYSDLVSQMPVMATPYFGRDMPSIGHLHHQTLMSVGHGVPVCTSPIDVQSGVSTQDRSPPFKGSEYYSPKGGDVVFKYPSKEFLTSPWHDSNSRDTVTSPNTEECDGTDRATKRRRVNSPIATSTESSPEQKVPEMGPGTAPNNASFSYYGNEVYPNYYYAAPGGCYPHHIELQPNVSYS